MRCAILLAAILLTPPVMADSPDISARRLLPERNGPDPMTRMLAEVITTAFSGGFSWRGSLAGKANLLPAARLERA
jgi:hypothetical protein